MKFFDSINKKKNLRSSQTRNSEDIIEEYFDDL